MKRYYIIQQTEKTADIYIFGDIVPYEYLDGDVSAKGIVNQIESLEADVINVHIDSYGGSVSEGWAIYNALLKHPATVNTYGDGFVASAALYPFMAGDNRYASNLSAYYFHQVMISASGYAEDLRAAANTADMMTEIGIGAFTERAKISADEVRNLMKAETWLSPEKALEYNIVTAITADVAPKYMQDVKRNIMQHVIRPLEYKPGMQKDVVKEENDCKPGYDIMQMLAGTFYVEKERS